MRLTETEIKKLIEDNITLVYGVVSKEYPTFIHDEDIISRGTLGLCKAANTWNPEKTKFSTYAWNCIRNEINIEFRQRNKYSNVISLDTTLGDDLTLEEVIVGSKDIDYSDDDSFYTTLTADERKVLMMKGKGYNTLEISETTGHNRRKVCRLLRNVQVKWDKYSK